MANDLTGRQWNIDTASTALVWPSNIKIDSFVFTGYSNAAHRVIAKDKQDRVVLDTIGEADKAAIQITDVGWVDGLKVTTLGSGMLIVHVG
jgi:hypothetical protein